jgi:small-conductance mechanosensitive channel
MDFIVFSDCCHYHLPFYSGYFRSVGTTLLTGAGVLAAIVGFASQSAFSNIISGFFLVIFQAF